MAHQSVWPVLPESDPTELSTWVRLWGSLWREGKMDESDLVQTEETVLC
jgi:hypothetical protein